MGTASIEISVKGRWVRVPALDFNGKTIVVRGNWLKVAYIHDEWWTETELEDPEACIEKLKEQGSHRLRADVFTFSQKIPGSFPKYNYTVVLVESTAARNSQKRAEISEARGINCGQRPR